MFGMVSAGGLERYISRLEALVEKSDAVDQAMVDAIGALILETRLRNAQYDNLAAKVDLVFSLIQRMASEVERREGERRIILPMPEETM